MLERLRQTWDGLERRQQASLAALAVVMVGAVVLVGVWATRPSWAVLYAELSPQDAQAVVEQLKEQGVPYRLAAGGTTVQVPQQRLYELRLQLAGEGLPASSTVGFELFDRASFSTSDLQNNVNLQRALQGELERSITTLEEIASARVHLALPEERLFSDEQEPPSASVVVGLRGGRLSTAQVAAIGQLVASAVPGLEPEAVTVVDTAGRVLSGGWDQGGGLQTMAQIEATRAWEESVRSHLQSMLDSVLGAHRSVVRVQAALDFQSQQLTREALEPPDGTGVVRREESTREQYQGSAPGEIGGPAGLTATEVRSVTGAGGGSYEHTTQSREYDYSRLSEQISTPPGRLQRLTVAVVIDESLPSHVAGQVQQLVETAAGADPERGDRITVEAMAIEAIKVAEEEAKLAEAAQARREREQSLQRGARYGAVVLVLAMVAAALAMLSRRLAPPQGGDEPASPQSGPSEPERQPGSDTLEFAPVSVQHLQDLAHEVPAAEPALAARLSELGTRSPEDFARQLYRWMSPEEGARAPRDEDA
ncbi:MAG: flagellar basal-body MS-ring/collar protein FliF [Armatimonadota bacterium]